MKALRIGVIGCAHIAQKYMLAAISSTTEFELVAVASRSKNKAESFARQYACEPVAGYGELVKREDIDVVYIPLPNGLHTEWVLKALQTGKHVLVEKPLTVNYASTKQVIEAAQSRQLLVMENFMFQHHSQHGFVQKLIAADEIGGIHFFKSAFGFPPLDRKNFRYNKHLGGGSLLDAGCYPLKAAQLFLGPDLQVEGAFLHYDQETGVDLYGGALLRNHQDQIAQVCFSFDNYYQCYYEIWGRKGKIFVDRAFTPPPNYSPKIILEQQNHKQEFVLQPENHFINILKAFYQAIQERDFRSLYDEALIQANLLEQIRRIGHAQSR